MLKMIDLTNAGLLLFGCTVCDACVKNSSLVPAVYSDLSWGKIQKAHCVFFFFLLEVKAAETTLKLGVSLKPK